MREKDIFKIKRMALSQNDISIIHAKSPWLPMWWSAALPGLGQICQGFYLKGLVLMTWEILVNLKAGLNLAILHTLTGRFELAGEMLDPGWALFYGVIFFFSIYDSYRVSVEGNLLAALEKKQSRKYFKLIDLNTGGKGYLNRGNPWVAALWSVLLTGFGHMYNGKAFKALILLGWTVSLISLSNLNEAVIATFNGNFGLAKKVVDYQWLLFFPSIYVFGIWDSYNDAVEINKLFAQAQKYHLRRAYPAGQFPVR